MRPPVWQPPWGLVSHQLEEFGFMTRISFTRPGFCLTERTSTSTPGLVSEKTSSTHPFPQALSQYLLQYLQDLLSLHNDPLTVDRRMPTAPYVHVLISGPCVTFPGGRHFASVIRFRIQTREPSRG